MERWACLSLVLWAGMLVGCQDGGRPSTVASAAGGPNTELARQENDRAFALIQQGKYAEAEPILNKAVSADVTFGPAHNNLGLVYFHLKRSPMYLYDAAREFDYAARLMPFQPDPRNNLGLVFEETGKFREAVESYERARKMSPDNPEFIGNLARVRVKRGDRDEETKRLLEELTFKDARPDWRDWARMKLFELGGRTNVGVGTTLPAIR